MIDQDFIRDVARAVDDLRLKTTSPQFRRAERFEMHAQLSTFSDLIADESGRSVTQLPIMLLGLPVVHDQSVPPHEVWIVEPRSARHVAVRV